MGDGSSRREREDKARERGGEQEEDRGDKEGLGRVRMVMEPVTIVYGVLGGAVYALSGYFKAGTVPNPEAFEPEKFLRTLVLGGLVGAVAAVQGIPLDSAEGLLYSTGVVAVVENVVKAAYRRFVGR